MDRLWTLHHPKHTVILNIEYIRQSYPSLLGPLEIDFLSFSDESISRSTIQLNPLRYPQKLNYSQSNLIDQDPSVDSIPIISHQKINVDTSISSKLTETGKFVIHSLVLKVQVIRIYSFKSTQIKRTV